MSQLAVSLPADGLAWVASAAMRLLTTLFAICLPIAAQDTVQLPIGGDASMEMVLVPAGTFSLGSEPDVVREVTLTRPFLIGKYPVTRGEFSRFCSESGYRTSAETGTSGGFGWESGQLVQRKQYTWRNPGFPQADDHPVVLVDFADAKAFCSWMSTKTGRQMVLPTEAQWEFAAKGGGSVGGACTAENSAGGTRPVGQSAANGYGIHDMLGNAWEWCEDWFAPYQSDSAVDPLQTQSNLSEKPRRVLRGGAFTRPSKDATASRRYRNDPGSRNADNGFRVLTLDISSEAGDRAQASASEGSGVPSSPLGGANQSQNTRPMIPLPVPVQGNPVQDPGSTSQGATDWLTYGVIVVGALFLGVIMVVASAISRAARDKGGRFSVSRMRAAGPAIDFSIRVVNDGFWIQSSAPTRTLVETSWTIEGKEHSRVITFRPGKDGHFVFTNQRPQNVEVSLADGNPNPSRTQVGSPKRGFRGRRRGGYRGGSRFRNDASGGYHGYPSAY